MLHIILLLFEWKLPRKFYNKEESRILQQESTLVQRKNLRMSLNYNIILCFIKTFCSEENIKLIYQIHILNFIFTNKLIMFHLGFVSTIFRPLIESKFNSKVVLVGNACKTIKSQVCCNLYNLAFMSPDKSGSSHSYSGCSIKSS